MNPKKVKCPICGKTMVAENWGMKRHILYCQDITNYVHYICDCGNKMDYEGTENCWENKCATKK